MFNIYLKLPLTRNAISVTIHFGIGAVFQEKYRFVV